MSFMVPLTMFGWPLVVLAMFMIWPPRRAAIAAFITGWLFLPMAGYGIPGFTDYTKTTVTSMSVLLGVAIFDGARLGAFRPRLWDLPLAILCLSPLATSVARGYGVYAGISAVIYQSVMWAVPYSIGRLYLTDR